MIAARETATGAIAGPFLATRRRLALWYAIATAVLLVLVACGFYGYARATLIERVDDTIEHAVELVVRSLVVETAELRDLAAPPGLQGQIQVTRPRVNIEASFRDNSGTVWTDVEDDRIDLEWFSPRGDLLWTSFDPPLPLPLKVDRHGTTVHLPHPGGEPGEPMVLRQLAQPVHSQNQLLGYLRVSHPWFEVSRPVRRLVLELGLGTGALVVTVAVVGWWLSGIAMEPVRESYQRLRQFTADASHELRNPIATIQTQVQVALATPEPTLGRSQLETLERLTRRLGRLVEDLLFLARQDSPPGDAQGNHLGEAVPLDELLAAVLEEQQAIAQQRHIRLDLELDALELDRLDALDPAEAAAALCVRGDRDRLARLFVNLLDNALQYTPPGGRITVLLDRPPSPETGWRIQIQDTGIGIPPDAIPLLFERFYRVDPSRRRPDSPTGDRSTGTGLGLAIAQAIVRQHGGRIAIASQPDQGTTATVTLPPMA